MTSPVDRISGPRTVSTPGNLTKGKTDSLTAMWGNSRPSHPSQGSSVSPSAARVAILASGSPIVFETKGTGREARGVHLQHVDGVVPDGELHVDESDHAEGPGERLCLGAQGLDLI